MTHRNVGSISSSKLYYLHLFLLVILLGLSSYLYVSNADSSEITNAGQLSEGNPTIEFMFVPPYGSSYNLIGRSRNADPDSYKVAVYILVGAGWWTKPTFAEPLTSIDADSIWITDITTGGNDPYATKIHTFFWFIRLTHTWFYVVPIFLVSEIRYRENHRIVVAWF